ncbi:LysR family transcriptional regulator [Xanthomonas campestris]|uniref:LysR family transcriptional regulator n=1 Tax=Xanthomonas campestris TaxID=339 RepID=UPI001E536461|nr:LysR family transcriptional regulator [Xanthomonas campestris]MCC5068270.1 LysR family transcriptional regulator [Xanthomonas campestris]
MFNPQWLASFRGVVELQSFTRTAEKLGLTQAAVSQHLRQLEQQLGPLVVRRPRAIELTPAGSALLEYCQEMAGAQKRLDMRLKDGGAAGDVGLISPGSIGLLLYPRLLDLQTQRPELRIRHRFAPDPEVLDAVLRCRFDLGIVTRRPDDARLAATALTEEPLELVVPVGKAIACWQDLEALGFIDHPDGQAMATRLLPRHFPGQASVATLPLQGFSNQIALILEPVARGLGFTVIPRSARLAFHDQAAIQVVEGLHPVVDTLWLIHRAEWPLSARAQQVVACMHAVFVQQVTTTQQRSGVQSRRSRKR